MTELSQEVESVLNSKNGELAENQVLNSDSQNVAAEDLNVEGNNEVVSVEENNISEIESEETEKQLLSRLTEAQINALIKEGENNLEKSKDTIAQIQRSVEKLKNNECKVLWSSDKKVEIEKLESNLRSEEVHLQELKKRIAFLKSIKATHRASPLSKLPQVILCSPWKDPFMPMVVVCKKSRKNEEQEIIVKEKLLDCLTEEQLEIIEKEKRWIALECGDLMIQIAGIKGKTKVIKTENDVLRAVVCQDKPNPMKCPVKLVLPRKPQIKPCRKDGMVRGVVSCPMYETLQADDIPVMEITITSKLAEDVEISNLNYENMEKDVEYIKKKTEDLQDAIRDAKQMGGTLKSQQDALKCVTEAIK